MRCTECGQTAPATSRYCTRCGGRLPVSAEIRPGNPSSLVGLGFACAGVVSGLAGLDGALLGALGILFGSIGVLRVLENPRRPWLGLAIAAVVVGFFALGPVALREIAILRAHL